MEILITGSLKALTSGISDKMAENHKVVCAGEDINPRQMGKKVTMLAISPGNGDFEKIFNSYKFSAVLFFSQPLSGKQDFNEYHNLQVCLKLCAAHDVDKFLYLQPALSGPEEETLPEYDLEMLFSACNRLCDFYRSRRSISVIKMRVPILYGYGEKQSLIGRALFEAQTLGSVCFDGAENQVCGFLNDADLGELLLRVLEGWTEAYDTIDVPAASEMTFKELGAHFRLEFPNVRISYSEGVHAFGRANNTDIARREFGWIPIRRVEDELGRLKGFIENSTNKQKRGLLLSAGGFFKRHSLAVKLLELAVGFFIMEFLNRITLTAVQFRYIDFRLLYIVLLSTIHGMKTGLGSAALAGLSLAAASISETNNWMATVYNIDTWLPYLFYFFAGTVTGYVKDRLRGDNEFLKKEKAVLEDKYILLNEFYAGALQNKEHYKTQIMSYRESFGRLFDVTKSLDRELADAVFSEALNALEGILDNKSVCIYSCDSKRGFARLIACSKEIFSVTDKSLNLSAHKEMYSQFADGEVG